MEMAFLRKTLPSRLKIMEIDTPIEGPTANECLEYCQTFAEVTDTNNAVGMMFLQQTSWNLDVGFIRSVTHIWLVRIILPYKNCIAL